jgi:hypothetical protein
MADRDILFAVRNNFFIGAYNNAINEASGEGAAVLGQQQQQHEQAVTPADDATPHPTPPQPPPGLCDHRTPALHTNCCRALHHHTSTTPTPTQTSRA